MGILDSDVHTTHDADRLAHFLLVRATTGSGFGGQCDLEAVNPGAGRLFTSAATSGGTHECSWHVRAGG